MKEIAKFVGKLPLAGKFMTEMLLFNIMFSKSPRERCVMTVIFMAELCILIACHAIQMFNSAGLVKMTTNPAIRVFGIFHALINLLVIVAEIYIIYRAANFLIRRRHRYCRSTTYRKTYSLREMLIALVVTFAWQITYMVLAEIVL